MCLKSLVNHRVSNSSGLMEEVHVLGLPETQFHYRPLSLFPFLPYAAMR